MPAVRKVGFIVLAAGGGVHLGESWGAPRTWVGIEGFGEDLRKRGFAPNVCCREAGAFYA